MIWRHREFLPGALTTGFAITLILASGEAALAQSWSNSRYGYGGYDDALMLMRIGMMAASTFTGFAIGWLFSPNGREAMVLLAVILGGTAVLAAVFDHGMLGWSAAFMVSVIGFFAGLGYWAARAFRALGAVPTTFGSAAWANPDDLAAAKLYGTTGIRLGLARAETGHAPISYQGDRHLLTVAPTRSGKGSSHLVPNLLTYEGSVLVIDPKGENAMITAKAREAMGQQVHICDPWGITDLGTASRFNPLDWLALGDVDITENAMLLADALVVPDQHGDRFWGEEAKALLQGVILYVATDPEEAGHRHLGRVRDLLLLDGEDQRRLFEHMQASPHHIVASTGARCLQKDPKLLANVMASAQAQTHFLDSARIRESLSASDFRFEDLKSTPMAIYLVLPADRLTAFGRWLRLLVQQAITVNARNIQIKPAKPVLFILDEMPALGRLTMIEQAYSLMAGFGFQLWGIVQDLGQLKRVYGDEYESFIANSGMVAYFGSPDSLSATYFSGLCGVTTVWSFSSALANAVSRTTGTNSSSSSDSQTNTDARSAAQRKLAYPDELMRLPRTAQLLLIEGVNPILATKEPWFTNPKLRPLGRDLHAPEPKTGEVKEKEKGNGAASASSTETGSPQEEQEPLQLTKADLVKDGAEARAAVADDKAPTSKKRRGRKTRH